MKHSVFVNQASDNGHEDFFLVQNVREGHMAYNKAPTKEELRKWGRLSRKGD